MFDILVCGPTNTAYDIFMQQKKPHKKQMCDHHKWPLSCIVVVIEPPRASINHSHKTQQE